MRYARARSLVDSTANAAIDLAFPFTIEQTERFFSLLFEVFWTSSPSSRPDPPDPDDFLSPSTTGRRVDGPG